MRKQATVARSTVVAARADSAARRCSAAASAPVRNSHSARCSSSAKVSSCRRSQRVLRQQCRAGDEIGERRGVGGRRLGALARDQVELGQLLALVARGDQGGAAIELIDDLEDRLLALLRRGVRREQPADPQMGLGALLLPGSANRRLPGRGRGGTVGALRAHDQAPADGLPEIARASPPPTPREPSPGASNSALLPRQASCCRASWVRAAGGSASRP